MGVALAYIAKLYALEKTARQSGVVGADLRLLRQLEAVPVLAELRKYLLGIREEVLATAAEGRWRFCAALRGRASW